MSSVNLKRQKELNAQVNEVMDDFDRFEFFFASHWKQIALAAVGVVVLVAVVFSVRAYFNYRQTQATNAFSQAGDVAALQAALARFGSSDAALAGRFRLADMAIADKDYNTARSALEPVAAGSAGEPAWRAKLVLASLLELEGKTAEAAAAFEAFAGTAEQGNLIFRAEAYAAAGRLYYQAGEADRALNILTTGRNFLLGCAPAEQSMLEGSSAQIVGLIAQIQAEKAAKK